VAGAPRAVVLPARFQLCVNRGLTLPVGEHGRWGPPAHRRFQFLLGLTVAAGRPAGWIVLPRPMFIGQAGAHGRSGVQKASQPRAPRPPPPS